MQVKYFHPLTLINEQGSGAPTRPTDVSSYSENVPPAQLSVRPYPWTIGALKMTVHLEQLQQEEG